MFLHTVKTSPFAASEAVHYYYQEVRIKITNNVPKLGYSTFRNSNGFQNPCNQACNKPGQVMLVARVKLLPSFTEESRVYQEM